MKLTTSLLFFYIFAMSCQFSSNEKAISKDICHCIVDLVSVNEEIKHSMNNSNGDVMSLFVKAGEENKKAMNCILNLSNFYGNINEKKYRKIIEELNRSCKDGVEAFQKSGWYADFK